jgi:hypothetical protein
MAIPEEQLSTWAQIGAQETSKATYATVKLALENEGAGYHGKAYSVFLQGSYGNDTNIRKESDVDVVIRLDAIFTYDILSLPEAQQAAFKGVHPDAVYTHVNFRNDVLKVLTDRFSDDVEPGVKAVVVNPRHTRRKADVLIATQHRKYSRFDAIGNDDKVTGISFHKSDGTRVANYPEQHRANLTAKNQATNEWFKHIVRIFKNARQKIIDEGVLGAGVAPSYYIEGLLYNVPNNKFGVSYAASVENVLRWLVEADRSQFKCANGQYILLDGGSDVSWNSANCDAFLNGVITLWNDW